MIERSLPRRLRTPVLLLLTTFAVGPRIHLTDVRAADAAPAPAQQAPAAQPVSHKTAAVSQAVPAVMTPAVFAKDVEGLSPKVLAMALDAMACARAKGVSGNDELLT